LYCGSFFPHFHLLNRMKRSSAAFLRKKFHRRCLPPLNRPSFTSLWPYKRHNENTPIIHRTHSAPISHPHARNHLLIEEPPITSFEHHRVVISTALSPSGAIGDNPDNLLSLSLSYHDDLSSPRAAALPYGHESTMDRETTEVS
jgi:hypothetical protein